MFCGCLNKLESPTEEFYLLMFDWVCIWLLYNPMIQIRQ